MPLIHHSGALGDFLLSLPYLRAVERRFRAERWTVALPAEHAALVQRIFPHVERVSPGSVHLAPLTARELNAERIAEVLDRHGGLAGFLPRARELSALARSQRNGLPIALLEPLPIGVASGRTIESVLEDGICDLGETRRPLTTSDFAIHPGEVPPIESIDDARALERLPADRPFALVHIGASDIRKAPGLSQLESWQARFSRDGITTVWVRGPVERERGVGLPAGPSLDCPGLIALAHAVLRAAIFAGGDTGPTHLASALGCSTLALHPTSNAAWRPRGARVSVVESV